MKQKVFLSTFLLFLAIISPLFFSSSCQFFRLNRLERKLDPVNAEFLSHVRYIITRKERKIFLELPSSEKAAFRELLELPDPELMAYLLYNEQPAARLQFVVDAILNRTYS